MDRDPDLTTGDRVHHEGQVYEAKWYTRDQTPGDPNGPWAPVA